MMSDKMYFLVANEDGMRMYDLMFNSLFTLKSYIEKYDKKVCGEEYQFDGAGLAFQTRRYFLLDDNNDFTITDKPPWE
jgi:hypothetical protein